MKIKQKHLDRLNAYFEKWQGANAFFNSYVDTSDRLIICLERPEDVREFIGICFHHCVFISGLTRWSNCELRCQLYDLEDGDVGFEIRDTRSDFVLRCAGPIVIGNGEFVIPSD
jgi:hypothetical protein